MGKLLAGSISETMRKAHASSGNAWATLQSYGSIFRKFSGAADIYLLRNTMLWNSIS